MEEQKEEQKEQKEEKEVKKEEKKEEKKEVKKEEKVSKKLEEIIKTVEELSVMELADLVKALEDKFGVSATPQVVASAGVAGGTEGEEGGEKKESVSVILQDAGQSKVQIIKAIKEIGLRIERIKRFSGCCSKSIKREYCCI